jgi:hypothetical protein
MKLKSIFSVLLTFCAAFAYADERPVFDEVNDAECRIYAPIPFTAQEPVSEENDQDETADNREEHSDEPRTMSGLPSCAPLLGESQNALAKTHSFLTWSRYKSNFGMEKIFIRFPQEPAVIQSSTLMTAFAYDHSITYSFSGYFPPIGNIDAFAWFDEILFSYSGYPYTLVSHAIYQVSGEWIMDYVVHDYHQDNLFKSRAIVTPFNGYILQCSKPYGVKDNFNYFLESFWIKCECND